MANYATLKASVQDVIKTNGNNEITGALLQQILLSIINALGATYQFAGVATPSTNPGTPDYNVAYIAGTGGIYANFNSLSLADKEIAILKYNGSWTKETVLDLTYMDDVEANDEYNAVRLEDGKDVQFIAGYYDTTSIAADAIWTPKDKYRTSETTKCAIIYCSGNEVFAYSLRGNTSTRRMFVLLDENDAVISYGTVSGAYTWYLVTPLQCRKILVNNIINTNDSPYFRKFSLMPEETKVNELLRVTGYGNLIPFICVGVFFDIRSNITSSTQKCTWTRVENAIYQTALIPCTEGEQFYINVLGTTASARAWFFLDANDIILSYATAAEYHEVLTAPTGAVRLVLQDKGFISSIKANYLSYYGSEEPSPQLTETLLSKTSDTVNWADAFISNNALNNLLDSARKTVIPKALETYNAYYRASYTYNMQANGDYLRRLTYFPEFFVKGGGTLIVNYTGLNTISVYELPDIPLGTSPIEAFLTSSLIASHTLNSNQESTFTGSETITLNTATKRVAFVMGSTQNVVTSPDDILNNITSLEVDILDPAALKPYEEGTSLPAGANQFAYDGPRVATRMGGWIRKTTASWGDIGTSANFGKYAVGITKGEGTFYMYNLETLSLLCSYSQTEKDSNIYHANCATFGAMRYDSNDYFPLLYVSVRANADAVNHPNQPSLNVYRVIPAWANGEIYSMTVQLVQVIWLTAMTDENGHGTPNVVYDAENNCFWSIGRQNNSALGDYHIGRLFHYPAPDTLQETTIDFDQNWPLGIDVVNMQGVVKCGNNLIFGRGYYTVGYIYLIVVNILTHQVTNVIDLMAQGFTQEPEGSLYYNGNYWMQTSASNLFEFYF